MEKKKVKVNNYIIYFIIAVIVILMLIFGRQREEEIETEEVEESVGSGFLEIETFPSNAEIFLDNTYSGKSPTTLYNVPVGFHNIVIKKAGYEDFIDEVGVEAGKKTFVEASLTLKDLVEEEIEVMEIVEEEPEEVEEENLTETQKGDNVINIGSKFLLYYDFSEKEFVSNRQYNSDVFSKRYDKYLVFTRYNPVNIKAIDKNITDVEKEDCIGITGQFEYLYSGQSLCVITKENNIVAIGGTWDNTENAELIWKTFD